MRTMFALVLLGCSLASHAFACDTGERGVWVALVTPTAVTTIERCHPEADLLHDQFAVLPGVGFDKCTVTTLGTFQRATIALTCPDVALAHRANIGKRGMYAVFEPRPEVSWRYDRSSLLAQLMLAEMVGDVSDKRRQEKSLRLFWPDDR